MVSYQYTYLIGNLILLAIWIFFFIKRKDTRKEMLIISGIFGFIAPVVESVYIKDWWQPLTITNTKIGLEDILFGFLIGGIISIIYEHLFKKRMKNNKIKITTKHKIIFPIILFPILFIGLSLLTNLNSFLITIISFIVPTLVIYSQRKDLIKNSLLSGLFTWLIAVIGYTILNAITPGFFEEFWYFNLVGKIIILNIPLEEHIWFFLAGAFIGPLYEYWQEAKLINFKN